MPDILCIKFQEKIGLYLHKPTELVPGDRVSVSGPGLLGCRHQKPATAGFIA
jgi:hypothetical protein